ncbi:MAG: PqiC family protein [Klebsiella michiganensis]|nr:PqiC family protein [Klebsiella michiganensis]MDU2415999.1 PqiC family protein [Klebsiella michiganensis]
MKVVLSLILGVTSVLAGCTSPHVRYHTLVSSDPVSHMVAPPEFAIDLLPVGVPAQLDTQQVVVRQSNSRMVVLDNDRWVSPLGDELQNALSLGITQQFNTVDVAGLARDNRKPVVRVLIQVRRFDNWPGNAVSLYAEWSLSVQQERKNRRLVCRSNITQPIGEDPAQMFSAAQQVVKRLSNQIGQIATDWVTKGADACRQN